jgi:CubicO group peptidase (beta-lactamase class C family)
MSGLRSATMAMLAAMLLIANPARAQDAPARLDAYATRLMRELPIPGMAVAVVHDGKPVLVRGYGLRDVERRLPVTARTAFYVASSTKSYTALLAALLADRGVVNLDVPIRTYLPDLRLPAARADVTLRQLLTHRSGLGNEGVVYRTAYTGVHDPALLVRLLAHSEVRDTAFAYSNLGYVVAGLVVQHVTGLPWQDLLAREVFRPLGLEHTSAYMSEAAAWEVALPYGSALPDGYERRPLKIDAQMHAAGGIVTSAADAARWLLVQIGDGRLGGEQVLPARVVRETHRTQAALDARFGELHRVGYGLGWYRAVVNGDTLVHHFGSYAGARAHISFMPSLGAGVAVFVNSSSPGAFRAADLLALYAYDVLKGRGDADARADARLAQLVAAAADFHRRMQADHDRRAARLQSPPVALERYAGAYHNPDFGTLVITVEGDHLVAAIGHLESRLEVYEGADLRAELIPGQGQVLRFGLAGGGPAASVAISDVRFERVR